MPGASRQRLDRQTDGLATESADVLVVCGAAGVGKSTTAHEVSARLRNADVPHALIDADELGHVHPHPATPSTASELARKNLLCLWSNYAALGHRKLIVVGVFPDIATELDWIASVVQAARLTAVRLVASPTAIEARMNRRAICLGGKRAPPGSYKPPAARVDPESVIQIDTSELSVTAVAARILALVGWAESST
jgi:hypothetical protein